MRKEENGLVIGGELMGREKRRYNVAVELIRCCRRIETVIG